MSSTIADFALRCMNVSKAFPLSRERQLWRILTGSESGCGGPMVEALRDISMTVSRGEIVGILGHNGAGKSTLLRLLGHVYTPSRGHIDVNGQIAGLFELGGMGNPNLTGREYATRYLTLMGIAYSEISNLLHDIADFSELGDAFDRRIRTYSSGMCARLYFSVATAFQYEIYLIDELLSVGDEHFQSKSWRRMRDRLLGGASGVLVTHDWSAVVRLCMHACVLEDGRFTFQGSSAEAVVNYLKLPIPQADNARFAESLPLYFVANSGEDFSFTVPIELLDDVASDCAFSIEMLRIGIGWEIVILTESFPVANVAGKYQMEFMIPKLPLPPGKYSLNLFLSKRSTEKLSHNEGLDVRSWTYGNGLELRVEGQSIRSAVRLPFKAKKIGEQ